MLCEYKGGPRCGDFIDVNLSDGDLFYVEQPIIPAFTEANILPEAIRCRRHIYIVNEGFLEYRGVTE